MTELKKFPHESNKPIKNNKNDDVFDNSHIPDNHYIENKLVTILKGIANPSKHCLNFNAEVIKSTLYDRDPNQQLINLLKAYNQGRESIMTTSIFGSRIDPSEFRIVVRNNIPELVAPSEHQMRKSYFLDPSTKTLNLCTVKQTDLFIGGYGSYLINVPTGKIALAWSGNIPLLFGSGPHVIHDANLKKIKDTDLVDINSEYIHHGTYHILRVYPGHCQKIWIDSTPYFLTPQNTPYVFNHAVFQKSKTTTKLSAGYIDHGNYNIIQVPKGKVAKVWLNSTKPMLLEESDEPYIFTDPSFTLDKRTNEDPFFNGFDKIIIHGPIKRIIPRTGEVAITYNNGNLQTFTPGTISDPIIITSVNHIFDRFLSINIQTIEFPSEKTIQRRIKENKTSKTDIDYPDVNYEVFRTSDGLPIGVKLLVVFEIDNPDLALSRLHPDNIMGHIENLVVADMGFIVQQCSSTDFLKSNRHDNKSDVNLQISDFYENLQQKVFKALKKDFSDYGIKLIRLNIETPKILDNKISTRMAEYSLLSTETNAKMSVMDKNYEINKREAEQRANQMHIKQEQENTQKIEQARAELEATKLLSEAQLMRAEAEMKTQKLLLSVAEERAKMYTKFPALLHYDMAALQTKAMQGVSSMIISPDVASTYFNMMPWKQQSQNNLQNLQNSQQSIPTLPQIPQLENANDGPFDINSLDQKTITYQ